ncbi:MAG: hypothetical protein Kapaf2KO_03090 [Candidatus Kapaibacteriales bacterium]
MIGLICGNEKTMKAFPSYTHKRSGRDFSTLPTVVDECRFFEPKYCRKTYPIEVLILLNKIKNYPKDGLLSEHDFSKLTYAKEIYVESISKLIDNVTPGNWEIADKIDSIIVELKKRNIDKILSDSDSYENRMPYLKSKLKRQYKLGEIDQKQLQKKKKEIDSIKTKNDQTLENIFSAAIKNSTKVEFPRVFSDKLEEYYRENFYSQ